MKQENSNRVHVIAEAGTNYNGKISLAKRLIRLAARAGADSVKFQIIDPDELYLPGTYKFGHYDIEYIRQLRHKTCMSESQWRKIAEFASQKEIPFAASVFGLHGLHLLAKLKTPYIKIASTDLNNLRLLRHVAQKNRPVIISTGMSKLGEIEKSVEEIVKAGVKDLTLMHCVSVYPASLDRMNLNFLDVLSSAFGFPVGLSDHTQSSIAACLALTKGVRYIEKHFTFAKSAEGLDHAYAAENQEFIGYVADIRAAQLSLKSKSTKIGKEELYTMQRARRALYAARDLPAGARVRNRDVLVVRPQNAMGADLIDFVIGKALVCPVKQYQPYSPDHFASHLPVDNRSTS